MLLANHLNNTFKTNFVVSGHPDGNKTLLKLNKVSEVKHLLKIIYPVTNNIPSISYKICVHKNIEPKINHIQNKYGHDVKIHISSSNRRRVYTEEEIATIIKMKATGATNKSIADHVGRSYWSIVYKIKELRKDN